MSDANYWAEHDRQVATEMLALCAASGAKDWSDEYVISADPEDPVEGEFLDRKFFFEFPGLEHNSGGGVTGVVKKRYQITLTEV